MCQLAGIPGRHTNHSLRATGATTLYTAGVPEKIIQEHTGHRSVECFCMYEHTSDKQQYAVSNIFSSSTSYSYSWSIVTTECSYGITQCHYYVIATDHVYAKSAELVHMKSRSLARLADSLLCSVMSQLSLMIYH